MVEPIWCRRRSSDVHHLYVNGCCLSVCAGSFFDENCMLLPVEDELLCPFCLAGSMGVFRFLSVGGSMGPWNKWGRFLAPFMPRKPIDAPERPYASLKGDGLVLTHPRRAPRRRGNKPPQGAR